MIPRAYLEAIREQRAHCDVEIECVQLGYAKQFNNKVILSDAGQYVLWLLEEAARAEERFPYRLESALEEKAEGLEEEAYNRGWRNGVRHENERIQRAVDSGS